MGADAAAAGCVGAGTDAGETEIDWPCTLPAPGVATLEVESVDEPEARQHALYHGLLL